MSLIKGRNRVEYTDKAIDINKLVLLFELIAPAAKVPCQIHLQLYMALTGKC